MIFLCERDQEQARKRQQRVAKATRRERKSSGYLGLDSHFHADNSCQTRQIANKKSDQWQFSKDMLISRYFFKRGLTIFTWVVKSGLLIGVKLKHGLMGKKSPGIRTPLKETNIGPNDCCRICRIYPKISGRSKINIFGYNNKDFSQTLSSVLSADVHDSMGLSQIICQKCQWEVVTRVLEQGKELDKFREKYNEAIKNQLAEYQLK